MKKVQLMKSLAPDCDRVTDYDRNCFNIYLQLLDADKESVPWKTVYETVFGERADDDLTVAKMRYESHLMRAKWMTACGFSQLI